MKLVRMGRFLSAAAGSRRSAQASSNAFPTGSRKCGSVVARPAAWGTMTMHSTNNIPRAVESVPDELHLDGLLPLLAALLPLRRRSALGQGERRRSGLLGHSATVASGAEATAMLDEMLGGNTLIYRASRPNAQFGLPTGHEQRVGQWTSEGLRPFPLDATFRQSVEQCRTAIDGK